ncbi:MAG: hypothetical protein KIS92_14220 [Planctomycetota bacterium]|nr:hypothetical protein [Planctomycetota bacterium]
MRPVYRSSGNLGRGPAVMLPLSLLLGAVTGLVYGYSCFYCIAWVGSQKISMLLATFIFLGLGLGVYKLAILSKCRSLFLVGLTGFLSGSAALYVAWSVFTSVLLDSYGTPVPVHTVMSNPAALWDFVQEVGEKGWYTTKKSYQSGPGEAEKGFILWAAWTMEALIATLAPAILSVIMWRGKVFCEACGYWCADAATVVRQASSDPGTEARLKTGDLQALAGLPLPKPSGSMYKVDQTLCKACGNTGTYKISKITYGTGKKDDVKTEHLTPLYLLDADSAAALGALLGPGATPPPPAPGVPPVPPAPPAV